MAHAEFETLREEMVEQVVLYASFIGEETGHSAISPEILNLMRSIPRHEFAPVSWGEVAELWTGRYWHVVRIGGCGDHRGNFCLVV